MGKITFLITLFLFFSFCAGALAQEAELPNPGLTPDSPFYFLDTLGEKIGMFFTFGAEKKAERAMKYAEEKLAEAKAMAEKNKPEITERANKKYQEFLSLANTKTQEAKEQGKDVEELAILITEKTLKHQEVLVEVFEKVPEEAKTAIEKAIEVSRKGSEEAVQAVTGAKKEELLQKIEEIKAFSACNKMQNTDPLRGPTRYLCLAMIKKDSSFCEMISGLDYQKRCYGRVALATEDSVICTKFENLQERKICELIAKRDPAACNIMTPYADYCYAQMAALKGDASICELINYYGGRIDCKAVVLKDASYCVHSDSEDCYQMLALLTGDEKVCEGLKERNDLQWSRNLDQEVNKCIKMARKEIIDCFIEPGTGIDCNLIPPVVANPSLCEQLKLVKDYCQKTYGPEDAQRCESEGWHLNQEGCYFSVAIRIADLLPLEAMLLPSFR